MRLPLILIFIVSISACIKNTNTSKNNIQNDLEGFKKFLGPEKSKADSLLVATFDQFLIDNFPNEKNQHQRTIRFMECILAQNETKANGCNYNPKPNEQLKNQLNKSGLMEEMWLYRGVNYDDYKPEHNVKDLFHFNESTEPVEFGELILPDDIPIEPNNTSANTIKQVEENVQDNHPVEIGARINYRGDYFYGIALFSSIDANIQEYIQAIVKAGDISIGMTFPVLLQKVENFDEPFIKRIIILESFFH